jgi:hypothetical protein
MTIRNPIPLESLAYPAKSTIAIWCAGLILPWLIATLLDDGTGIQLNPDDWLAAWRGFPFHFVTPLEFGDQWNPFSIAYAADALFWIFVFLTVRRRIRRAATSLQSPKAPGRSVPSSD